MAHLALYRKWRPQRFAEVVGQEHITRTLQNALVSGRIAHAYLFCGPRGTGKTTMAKLLAKAVNCERPEGADPCNSCASCRRINSGVAMDVLEIDGASNRGIDEIRDLREKVGFAPAESRYKVYIIDEVHMLTTEAFNALLKTLEEPPSHVLFIFATTEPHKVLATIRSRCQRFDFRRLSIQDLTRRLRQIADAEGITVTEEALRLIARYAEGGMRDAIGVMEQCTAFAEGIDATVVRSVLGVAGREHLVGITRALARRDTRTALLQVEAVFAEGDLRPFLRDLLDYWRDLLLVKLSGAEAVGTLGELSAEEVAALAEEGREITPGRLAAWLEVMAEVESDLRRALDPRLAVELALVKLTRPEVDSSPESLLLRIEALEERLAGTGCGIGTGTGEAVSRAGVPFPPTASQSRGQILPPAEAMPSPPANGGAKQAGGRSEGEPTPAKEPEAVAPAAGGAETGAMTGDPLARIQAAWETIRQKLKYDCGPALAAFLEVARPAAVQDGRLYLLFPSTHGFHHGNASKPENKIAVARTVQQLTGLRLEVETALGSLPPGVAAGGAAGGLGPARAGEHRQTLAQTRTPEDRPSGEETEKEKPGATAPPMEKSGGPGAAGGKTRPDVVADPLVREALNLFGGRIIKVEEPERDENQENEAE